MRTIKEIIIHCSATRPGQQITVSDIDRMHRARGWRSIGYHFVVYLDGSVNLGRPLEVVGSHALGRNVHSIGICYVGGLDEHGKPADTRTPAQKNALRELVAKLKEEFPGVRVLGHRDASPDLNGNGKIEKFEWLKACPCFDVATEL